tara:strand:- start:5290 stop:5535 length:246 start_codon:yes stop_codon:yes gene_type:complete
VYNKREKIKPGDTVIWEDGTVGIIIECVDIYKHNNIASRRNYSPSWSWIVKFPGDVPINYNERYGECAQNLRNKSKKIIHC